DKSSDSEITGFASSVNSSSTMTNASSSVDLKTLHKTDDQGPCNVTQSPSFSFKENVKTPRNLCNRNGSNNISLCKNKSFGGKKCFVCGSKFHLIRDCDFYENQLRLNNAPVWKNVENIPSFVPRPAYVPAGRPFPAGWHNPAAKPMTRPKSHYFQQFSRPGSYNQMDMDGGRWRTADNPHINKDLGIVDSGTHDDSDSECDEQVIVVPSFPSNHFLGPKVHTASATVESTLDYAEELVRLQGQAYEANSVAKVTWKIADTIPASSINQAAGGSVVPSTPSSSVVEPIHANDTPLPPGHSLGSSENSTRFSSPFDLANHISSSSEMEGIHHHPTTGIFSESTYDADFGGSVTNLAPTITVDPVPTRRVNNHTDYLHCLFACFLSQLEPSSVAQALNDPDWVEAMQEEMQQFVNQDVWKLVPLPEGKTAIGTKWILKNKRDARGIVVRNKARLVAQGHRQEEGIDYDEVFAPVARIEAIRLFLAFTLYMGFMVYQMDVKSAFLDKDQKYLFGRSWLIKIH
ncbi:putative ribonuclease H-like domain-containing protein, partial [Tanacetum coccineum]